MLTADDNKQIWEFFAVVHRLPQRQEWGRDIAILIARDEQRLDEIVSLLELQKGSLSLAAADFSHIVRGNQIPRAIPAVIIEPPAPRDGWQDINAAFRAHVEAGAKIIVFRLAGRLSRGHQEFLRRTTTNRPEGITGSWEIPEDVRLVILTTESEFENLTVEGEFWQLGTDVVGKALGPWLRM